MTRVNTTTSQGSDSFLCEDLKLCHISIGFFTIGLTDAFLSDYLTDLKLHIKNYILSNIAHSEVWTHNLWIISLMLHWLCLGGTCWRFLKWTFFCVMHHFTCWTLFISRINRAWLYKDLNDSHPQPKSDLAQLREQETDDLEVVSSNPTGGNFWQNLFCSV